MYAYIELTILQYMLLLEIEHKVLGKTVMKFCTYGLSFFFSSSAIHFELNTLFELNDIKRKKFHLKDKHNIFLERYNIFFIINFSIKCFPNGGQEMWKNQHSVYI